MKKKEKEMVFKSWSTNDIIAVAESSSFSFRLSRIIDGALVVGNFTWRLWASSTASITRRLRIFFVFFLKTKQKKRENKKTYEILWRKSVWFAFDAMVCGHAARDGMGFECAPIELEDVARRWTNKTDRKQEKEMDRLPTPRLLCKQQHRTKRNSTAAKKVANHHLESEPESRVVSISNETNSRLLTRMITHSFMRDRLVYVTRWTNENEYLSARNVCCGQIVHIYKLLTTFFLLFLFSRVIFFILVQKRAH